MKLNNNFKFIGRVCEEPKKSKVTNNYLGIKITLAVIHPYDKTKRMFIPLVAHKNITEKAMHLIKNGDVIMTIGEIITFEKINKNTSNRTFVTRLVMSDFVVLCKAKKQAISDDEYKNLVKLFAPEESVERKKKVVGEEK